MQIEQEPDNWGSGCGVWGQAASGEPRYPHLAAGDHFRGVQSLAPAHIPGANTEAVVTPEGLEDPRATLSPSRSSGRPSGAVDMAPGRPESGHPSVSWSVRKT